MYPISAHGKIVLLNINLGSRLGIFVAIILDFLAKPFDRRGTLYGIQLP